MSTALLADISAARGRSLNWIASMATTWSGAPVFRESGAHEPRDWPGMLLPGTYNNAMCLRLIGDGLDSDPAQQAAMAAWINAQRRPDGSWWLQGMDPADTFKKPDADETRAYLTGHITNYTLGALQALAQPLPSPDFAQPLTNLTQLKTWMAARDWSDPWLEGNNIVNLGSFLIALRDAGNDDAVGALGWLLDWHDTHTNPDTGFWGAGQDTPTGRLHAMAGATHNYHLYFALNRPVPHLDRAVDYCLSQPPRVVSACIDADLVDILANAAFVMPDRRDQIAGWLAELGSALIAFQNSDGGFADTTDGTRRFDGWVTGYAEPQGISNGFATFFRWIALAMIARVLAPDDHSWGFRRMVGLGYFRHG